MKTKETMIIPSDGDLTIANISRLKDEIAAKSKGKNKVSIEINELRDIDLAGLQLLISIRKYHPDVDYKIKSVTQTVQEILENTGLKSIVK